jgi:UDP-N-acetylmuramoyl-tripeptide--D-alanyl-D-alanine ligase
VPLTVCRTEPGTRFLVVEMGARGGGHLQYLTTIAPPDVSVVLNVGWAHAGEFGSVEAVQAAKSELVQALTSEGTAVLTLDDHRVAAMREHADRVGARVVGTGLVADAQVRAEDVVADGEGRPSFVLVSDLPEAPGRAQVRLGLHGEHHVANALSAAAVALLLGGGVEQVAGLLSGARPASRWRMEVTHRPDGVTVVNDAYNANPDSMRAALKALVQMGRPEGRTWAVLGGMLELGEESVRLHDEIGRLAVRLDVSRLVAVGEGARAIHTGAVMEGSWGEESVWVPDADAAFDLLHEQLRSGDTVLLKSSRDSGLRWLGERVAADAGAPAATVEPVHQDGSAGPAGQEGAR